MFIGNLEKTIDRECESIIRMQWDVNKNGEESILLPNLDRSSNICEKI